MGGSEKKNQYEKITAVVIDDDSKSTNILCHHLKTFFPELTLLGTASYLDDGISLLNQNKPDLVFLDIMLNQDTGFDLLDIINQYTPEVIFISSYDEYALSAFKYNPVDYLLKPINIKKLMEAVFRAQDNILRKREESQKKCTKDYITVSDCKIVRIVRIAEILYCKSDGSYTTLYLNNRQKIVTIKNIGIFEKILPKDIFIRIHKQYLVNFNYVNGILKSDGICCQLFDKTILPVSRRKQKELNKRLEE